MNAYNHQWNEAQELRLTCAMNRHPGNEMGPTRAVSGAGIPKWDVWFHAGNGGSFRLMVHCSLSGRVWMPY